jgi:hypothetical protein
VRKKATTSDIIEERTELASGAVFIKSLHCLFCSKRKDKEKWKLIIHI